MKKFYFTFNNYFEVLVSQMHRIILLGKRLHLALTQVNASYVLKLMDNFYSSIDMPEGTSLTLKAIYHKSEWKSNTYY